MTRSLKLALALVAFIAWLALIAVTEPGVTECRDNGLSCEGIAP